MPKLETIGAILREVRQEKGYKLEAVAKEIGCSKGTLSKIETGQKQPTITQLNSLAMVLGVNLSYILRDTLEPEDYELSLVKSFINRFVRITTVKDYFDKNINVILNQDESIFSLLGDNENALILQVDKSLFDFARKIAEEVNLSKKQEEFDQSIMSALRELHKSERGKEISSYCLSSIQDIRNMIDKAVEREVQGLRAIGTAITAETEN